MQLNIADQFVKSIMITEKGLIDLGAYKTKFGDHKKYIRDYRTKLGAYKIFLGLIK